MTDSNGSVAARIIYGAWGDELYATDSVPNGLDARFVGGLGVRNDAATGLVYMRARWYMPQVNRFISRDPIGLLGGSNRYTYAANQPNSSIDPLGLWTWSGEISNALHIVATGLLFGAALGSAVLVGGPVGITAGGILGGLAAASAFQGAYDYAGELGYKSGLGTLGADDLAHAISTGVGMLLTAGIMGAGVRAMNGPRVPLNGARELGAIEGTCEQSLLRDATPASGELMGRIGTHRNVSWDPSRGPLGSVSGGPGYRTIIFGDMTTKVEAIHEFLHGTQDSVGKMPALDPMWWSKHTEFQVEKFVADFIRNHPKLLGLTEADIKLSDRMLDSYRKNL